MKISKKIVLIITYIMITVIALMGCSSEKPTKPEDIIGDAYGSQEFNISFSADNLDTPISNMKYSAKYMPKLPNPERVGYIFSGWYLDASYTIPYTDNILYLYMRDVTLYAKWEKEKFVEDGVYDIEIEARIDEIMSKGELVDEYGMYDLSQDIIKEETCIEKSEDGLLLKLQYNTRKMPPFGGSPSYKILPSKEMGDDIYVVDKIVPDNDTTHTIYFNIDKLELTDTIYLDVHTINYDEMNMSETNRNKTKASYKLAIDVTKIVGFTRPFVDPNVSLENNSYYLVKTHYNSMAESYNPVYSYISVDNEGNYTLIKPFMPYTGVIAMASAEGIRNNYIENFYHRGMSFSPMLIYYRSNPDKDYSQDDIKNAEYLPSLVNGEYYGEYTIEFNGDTGRYYMLYDLGKDLKKEFIISGATTGFMEMTGGMGRYNQKMTLDYDHIVQLAEIDYKPLDGDAYVYHDTTKYYPGKVDDLNKKNLLKDIVDTDGISTNIFNFYYTADNFNSPIEDRRILSHKVTISPKQNANSEMTKDARYKVADFDVVTEIYGYNPSKDKRLFADSMTVSTFGGCGLREKLEIQTGKMLNVGDKVWLKDLFKEKVNPNINIDKVEVSILDVNNNIIDYTSGKKVSMQDHITFAKPLVVEFKYFDDDHVMSNFVYLDELRQPSYNINHNTDGYKTNSVIDYTDINYTWGKHMGKFEGSYFFGQDEPTFDPTKIIIASMHNGEYRMSYLDYNAKNFTMGENKTLIGYEMSNQFREKKMVYLEYNAITGDKYKISKDGNVIAEGFINKTAEGDRIPVSFYDRFASECVNKSLLIEELSSVYTINIIGVTKPLEIEYANVYMQNDKYTFTNDIVNNIINLLGDNDYAFIELMYKNGNDLMRKRISYNIKIGGKGELNIIQDETLFTDYDYIVNVPNVLLPNGAQVKGAKISIYDPTYSGQYNVKNNNGQYTVRFYKAGDFSLVYTISLAYDEYNNRIIAGDDIELVVRQKVKVVNKTDDLEITFITDKEHPFAEGIPYTTEMRDGKEVYCHTIKHNMNDIFITMREHENFNSNNASLYLWSPKPWSEYGLNDAKMMYNPGEAIDDIIKEFGSNNIELYAIWDKGITYTVDMNFDITGQTSYSETVRLSKDDQYKGWYTVYPPSKDMVKVPKGWIFSGWTIVETGELRGIAGLAILTRVPITIKATFIRDYIVRYDVDSEFGYGIPNSNIEQYKKITPPNPTAKDGYKFVGFRLATKVDELGRPTEIAKDNFDFSRVADVDLVNFSTGTHDVIIFVAVFEDADGNEVWQKEVTP